MRMGITSWDIEDIGDILGYPQDIANVSWDICFSAWLSCFYCRRSCNLRYEYGCRRTSKKLLFALELVLPASSFLITGKSVMNP